MSIDQKFMPSKPKLLEFAAKQEPWCVYELKDGTLLKIRIMATKIIDSGERTPDGYPPYNVQMQQVMDMTWPDHIHTEAAARRGDDE